VQRFFLPVSGEATATARSVDGILARRLVFAAGLRSEKDRTGVGRLKQLDQNTQFTNVLVSDL
jgi:hypothetical protein